MTQKFEFSQENELIMPQKQRSYPIPIIEWSNLKKKINDISENVNFWQTIGSILIGTAIPTLITALIGDFKSDKATWICWSAFSVTLVAGVLCFYFSKQQRSIQSKTKSDVIDSMDVIEARFPTD